MADRDNRAADKAFSNVLDARDFAAADDVVHSQISFIEVYVLRLIGVVGLTVPVFRRLVVGASGQPSLPAVPTALGHKVRPRRP